MSSRSTLDLSFLKQKRRFCFIPLCCSSLLFSLILSLTLLSFDSVEARKKGKETPLRLHSHAQMHPGFGKRPKSKAAHTRSSVAPITLNTAQAQKLHDLLYGERNKYSPLIQRPLRQTLYQGKSLSYPQAEALQRLSSGKPIPPELQGIMVTLSPCVSKYLALPHPKTVQVGVIHDTVDTILLYHPTTFTIYSMINDFANTFQ